MGKTEPFASGVENDDGLTTIRPTTPNRFRKSIQHAQAARLRGRLNSEEKSMVTFRLNGEEQTLDVDPSMPLLWAIRENFGLTGTKFGCGLAQCGACTVHVNGNAIRSCVTPVAAVQGGAVTTIEGLSSDESLHPLQQAWIDEQAPQCGYCQSGQIMSAAALLASNPNPDDEAIDQAMSGNICRCGMYQRIRKAIKRAASSEAVVGIFDPAAAQSATKEADHV
jgi:isoquinoline 1-oxidoreductase alpha subunit